MCWTWGRVQKLMQSLRAGHQLSQTDGNSTEGGDTQRYLRTNFRRTNSSTSQQHNMLPPSEGPPAPYSPPTNRPLLDYQPAPIAAAAPLVSQEETQLLPDSPRGYISPADDSKKSEPNKKVEKFDELPSEFECCFCTTKDYKEFIDAESLMPRPTSDFRNPVCLEMKTIRTPYPYISDMNPPRYTSTTVAIPTYFPSNGGADNINNNFNNNNEMGSVDSSDTFASCNTHPFFSQGDLTSDVVDASCALADSNLYVNPMDKSTDNSPVQTNVMCFGRGKPPVGGVKKSASGDTALRSLGASPSDEGFKGFGAIDRGSRGSLNDSPLPKHRKTRFQQSVRQRARFGDSSSYSTDRPRFESQESLEGKKSSRRASFMPARSLASATRIINQHLFGLQTLGGSRTGKNGSSKSSLSVDSIDSHASPQLEQHRRSKSILKKSDNSGHRNGRSEDPESERLISDNQSASGVDAGSGSDYSPNKRPTTTSPPVRHRTVSQRTASAKTIPAKYQQQTSQDSEKTRALKSPLFLLDDILAGDKRTDNKFKDNGDVDCDAPLYICPPPPPMDENSPTEETRLLLHQTPVPQHKQMGNSTTKGSGLNS